MVFDFSVIIPVHNAEGSLHIVLKSLLEQKGVCLQIILVENGSIDASKEICEQYAKRYDNIEVFCLESGNVSLARNKGIRHAKGEFVSFVDADDYIKTNMFHDLLYNQNIIDSDIVLFDYYRCTDTGCEVGDVISNVCKNVIHMQEENELLRKAFIGPEKETESNYMATVWRAVFKRQFLIENKLEFKAELRIGEDMMFLVEALSKKPKIKILDKVYYYYVVQKNSATSKITETTWHIYNKLFEYMISYFQSEGDLQIYANRIQRKQKLLSEWVICEIAKGDMPYQKKKELLLDIYHCCHVNESQLFGKNKLFNPNDYKILLLWTLIKGYLVRFRNIFHLEKV